MKYRMRIAQGLFVVLAGLATAGPAIGYTTERSTTEDAQVSLRTWSDSVWRSALTGDRSALEERFSNLPETGAAADQRLLRMREALDSHRENTREATAKREEARAKAMEQMHASLSEHDLSDALKAAVEVQTLDSKLDSVFDDPKFSALVEEVAQTLPELEKQGEWLRAQELVFRMRTLYEDTGHTEEYKEANEKLEWINHRLMLMLQYAPKRLHELRNAYALAEDPEAKVEEFNPAASEDWREGVDGVDYRMVKSALKLAADEHIEGEGWMPLIRGGLNAVTILATTPDLIETFPSLGEPTKVASWVEGVERIRQDATQQYIETDGRRPNFRDCDRYIGDLQTLNRQTIDLPIAVIVREFADGAMGELDEYSEIIWPAKLRRFEQSTRGHFVGVGILIRHDEKRDIVIVNPLEGSPAYFAGVRPGDRIVEVDGTSTVGWRLNDAVDRITGKEGTVVQIGVKREGEDDIRHFPITRKEIKIRSVNGWWKTGLSDRGEPEWDWYIDPFEKIAYIKLTQFSEDTFDDLRKAWRQINEDGKPNGVILDLRYNPGGLLSAAVQVSNLFVTRGSIVSGEDKLRLEQWRHDAQPQNAEIAAARVPIVVLVNEGSASASEIVAGALQAHGAAVVVGTRSYGKGSVQTVHPVAPNAVVKLTTQYYRLPAAPGEDKGKLVHKRPGAEEWGVEPSILVKMTPEQLEAAYFLRQNADIIPDDENGKPNPAAPDRPRIQDLIDKGLDPQLEMAMLILTARAVAEPPADDARHAALN
jgi:carboxyl-terminal processing protease